MLHKGDYYPSLPRTECLGGYRGKRRIEQRQKEKSIIMEYLIFMPLKHIKSISLVSPINIYITLNNSKWQKCTF